MLFPLRMVLAFEHYEESASSPMKPPMLPEQAHSLQGTWPGWLHRWHVTTLYSPLSMQWLQRLQQQRHSVISNIA